MPTAGWSAGDARCVVYRAATIRCVPGQGVIDEARRVSKRFFAPDGLLDALGGGRVRHAGRWLVMVAAP